IAGIAIGPADRLAGLDMNADRIVPHMRAVTLALHGDLDRVVGQDECRSGDEGGEDTPTDLHHAPARQDHFATSDSSAAETCHNTTWTCGSSTPGWPAL